jgi:hypothetical protein
MTALGSIVKVRERAVEVFAQRANAGRGPYAILAFAIKPAG